MYCLIIYYRASKSIVEIDHSYPYGFRGPVRVHDCVDVPLSYVMPAARLQPTESFYQFVDSFNCECIFVLYITVIRPIFNIEFAMANLSVGYIEYYVRYFRLGYYDSVWPEHFGVSHRLAQKISPFDLFSAFRKCAT